jgi:hypothetical protein
MSMSTQHGGGNTRPSSSKPGGKPKDAPAGKTGSAAPGGGAKKGPRPGGAGGKGGPRKPITPVKVNGGRNWGPIVLFSVVGAIALGIVGFGGYQVYQNSMSWEDRAAAIPGIKNYRKSDPQLLKYEKHLPGKINYPASPKPPVGGPHNDNWQRCLGDMYNAPIASEHALHSMEHGAVWITYQPDLPKAQVDELAKKVKGRDFMLMSPFEGQDKPISLQTWGYQLKVDKADDPRIDEFIKALREISQVEARATCSQGSYITQTGTTPRDLAPPQGGMPAGGAGAPGGTG